jgi:hypothetical protein
VEDRPELPKALAPIRAHFDYLIKKQYVYGYSVFLNINITRINIDDVKKLTEIAHDAGIATDYHINESPMMEHEHFKHASGNSTYISPDDWPPVDAVVGWLIEKNRAGYKMVNSVRRLEDMKAFMRGKLQEWDCRAGQNSLIIRTDGSLAPCFPLYSATCDWGCTGDPRFDSKQLLAIKQECQPALLFDAEPHPCSPLRCRPNLPLAGEASRERVPRYHRPLRRLNSLPRVPHCSKVARAEAPGLGIRRTITSLVCTRLIPAEDELLCVRLFFPLPRHFKPGTHRS